MPWRAPPWGWSCFAGLGGTRLLAAPELIRAALAAAVAGPVALLPGRPLVAWRIAMAASLITLPREIAPDGVSWPWHPAQVVIMPALVLLVALRHRPAVLGWVWLATAATMAVQVPPADVPTVLALVTFVAVVGDQARRRREAQRHLTVERDLNEREQAHRAVLEERARIARELHDVVAHHMSLITVRAESAPYRLGREPGGREAEFAAIAEASRDALTEMRRMLGVLRTDRATPDREPQPGLADIPAMVAAAADAGLDVGLDPESETGGVPASPAVGLSAYRIVQEGLSNATRHTPGAAVRVRCTVGGGALHVRVRNSAPAGQTTTPSRDRVAGGHGIVGMRERAAVLGGALTAGPTSGGGYQVDAVLPLAA